MKDVINYFLKNPTAEYVYEDNDKGDWNSKIKFSSPESPYQVWYDVDANYFRVLNTYLPGKKDDRKYTNLDGSNANNKIENGKQKGRNGSEYQAATQFKNNDEEIPKVDENGKVSYSSLKRKGHS